MSFSSTVFLNQSFYGLTRCKFFSFFIQQNKCQPSVALPLRSGLLLSESGNRLYLLHLADMSLLSNLFLSAWSFPTSPPIPPELCLPSPRSLLPRRLRVLDLQFSLVKEIRSHAILPLFFFLIKKQFDYLQIQLKPQTWVSCFDGENEYTHLEMTSRCCHRDRQIIPNSSHHYKWSA